MTEFFNEPDPEKLRPGERQMPQDAALPEPELPDPDLAEPTVPEPLVAKLKSRQQFSVVVPESVDRAVLADARQHLRSVRTIRSAGSIRRRIRWVAVSLSSVAALVLIIAFQQQPPRQAAQPAAPMMKLAGASAEAEQMSQVADAAGSSSSQDLNNDGRVDILDAFALARMIEHQPSNDVRWDFNQDGGLNQGDVDLIAMNAVMISYLTE